VNGFSFSINNDVNVPGRAEKTIIQHDLLEIYPWADMNEFLADIGVGVVSTSEQEQHKETEREKTLHDSFPFERVLSRK
jgi:hypothetical protein